MILPYLAEGVAPCRRSAKQACRSLCPVSVWDMLTKSYVEFSFPFTVKSWPCSKCLVPPKHIHGARLAVCTRRANVRIRQCGEPRGGTLGLRSKLDGLGWLWVVAEKVVELCLCGPGWEVFRLSGETERQIRIRAIATTV